MQHIAYIAFFFLYGMKIGFKGNPSFFFSVLSQWRCVVNRNAQMFLEKVVLLHSNFQILWFLESTGAMKTTQKRCKSIGPQIVINVCSTNIFPFPEHQSSWNFSTIEMQSKGTMGIYFFSVLLGITHDLRSHNVSCSLTLKQQK